MLSALAAGLIRSIYIDGFYQFMKDIGGKRLDANILACLLNKLLNVLNASWYALHFFFPQRSDNSAGSGILKAAVDKRKKTDMSETVSGSYLFPEK